MSWKAARNWCASVIAALGATACEQAPYATTVNFVNPGGTWSYLTYATKDGPLLLEVHGNPFGGSQETLDQNVATAIEKAIQKRIIRVTTDKEKASQPNFRVVAVFSPPPT